MRLRIERGVMAILRYKNEDGEWVSTSKVGWLNRLLTWWFNRKDAAWEI